MNAVVAIVGGRLDSLATWQLGSLGSELFLPSWHFAEHFGQLLLTKQRKAGKTGAAGAAGRCSRAGGRAIAVIRGPVVVGAGLAASPEPLAPPVTKLTEG